MRELLERRENYIRSQSPDSFALEFVSNPFWHFSWDTIDDDLRLKFPSSNSFRNPESYTKDPDRFFALAHELLQHERRVVRAGDSPQKDLPVKVDEYRDLLGMLARLSTNLTPTQLKLNSHAQNNHSARNRSFHNYENTPKSIVEYTNWLVYESYGLRDEYYLNPKRAVANAYIELMTDWYEFARRESRVFDFDKLEAGSLMLSSLEAELLLLQVD